MSILFGDLEEKLSTQMTSKLKECQSKECKFCKAYGWNELYEDEDDIEDGTQIYKLCISINSYLQTMKCRLGINDEHECKWDISNNYCPVCGANLKYIKENFDDELEKEIDKAFDIALERYMGMDSKDINPEEMANDIITELLKSDLFKGIWRDFNKDFDFEAKILKVVERVLEEYNGEG